LSDSESASQSEEEEEEEGDDDDEVRGAEEEQGGGGHALRGGGVRGHGAGQARVEGIQARPPAAPPLPPIFFLKRAVSHMSLNRH
jgi:hypothetical protein